MMKRLILFISTISMLGATYGQYVTDALNYSLSFPAITARSMSMGNAFTSLGGDFSSVFVNPAGLGIYRGSEFVVSPGLNYTGTKASYFGQSNDDYSLKPFANLGYVGTYQSGKESGLVSASYAVGYSRLNSLGNKIYIKGINPDNSLADYFMSYADGTDPEDLNSFYERLAFDSYIIDTIPGSDFLYQTPVMLPITQRKTIDQKGGTGEWDFALGMNFSNVFYTGLDLGFQRINMHRSNVHSEFDDYNLNDFNNFSFFEDLDVSGTGFSMKLGILVRVLEFVRIGGSLHMPTFYKISENYYNTLRSEFDGNEVYDVKPTDKDANLLDKGQFDYRLNTPLKLLGGVSVQLGSAGIISADVEYIDYSGMRLRDVDNTYDFTESNRDIESIYRPVANVRAGGEIRLGNFAFRAGGGYYPSPFTAAQINSNAGYGELTGGFGYRDNNIFFDFGFSGILHNEKYIVYQFANSANIAGLDQNRFRMLLSFGIRL
jgi:hypothetical protein